jgi:acetyl-CoA carboxylase carboxyl transferase subunit alpha
VISPEGAASILWRDSTRAKEAASNMKITAEDLKSLGVIDAIIPEPVGGAHRDAEKVIAATGDVIANALAELAQKNDLRADRRQKFLDMGRQL